MFMVHDLSVFHVVFNHKQVWEWKKQAYKSLVLNSSYNFFVDVMSKCWLVNKWFYQVCIISLMSFFKLSSCPALWITKKGGLDSQPQVIKFTSCLQMVGGSLQVLRLLPPLRTGRHDIAEILLKVALITINQIN